MFSDQTKQNLCVGTKAISKREPGLKMILIQNIQFLKHGPNLIQIKNNCSRLKRKYWDTFYISLALVSLIQMSPNVPEVIKEEFRKNLADGNEKYNDKWASEAALNSVENLTSQWSGCGWSATGKTQGTLKTLVRSPTIRARGSQPATIPISTRFDHFGCNLTWITMIGHLCRRVTLVPSSLPDWNRPQVTFSLSFFLLPYLYPHLT